MKLVFVLFPLCLPLPLPLLPKSIFLGLFMVASILFFNDFGIRNNRRPKIIVTSAFIVFFIVETLTAFLRDKEFFLHEVRLSFIFIPMIHWFANGAFTTQRKLIFHSFVIGVYAYIGYAVAFIVFFYGFYSENSVFGLDYYLKYVLYHFMPGAIHHTYTGMFMCVAVLILLFEREIRFVIRLVMIMPILFSMPFLGSKLSLVVVVLILFYWLIKQRGPKKWKWAIILALVLLNSALFLFTDLFRTLSVSIGKRVSYYECLAYHYKDNLFLGIGTKKIKEFMENCPLMGEKMDTHNLFLQELLTSGILGIAALVFLFVVLYRNARNNEMLILFLTVFLIFGMVEHLFNIQLGVTFFVFFCFVMLDIIPKEKITNQ